MSAAAPIPLFDRGRGAPVVVVPPLPGRWPWIAPALQCLTAHCRVVSYSLCGEPDSGRPAPSRFDDLTEQLAAVVRQAGLTRAVICGISLGGLIALRFAATHPAMTAGLVLASTPGPRFELDTAQRRLVRNPVVLSPVFALTWQRRLGAELRHALPDAAERVGFALGQLRVLLHAWPSPTRMASRVELALGADRLHDCARVVSPALVVTGAPSLDRIVPVASSREYEGAIAGARVVELADTGHLGVVTRPEAWAAIVARFTNESILGREVA
ncbi:MAG: alpha/beta fold hydrolase [Vicinamibacterales bacterium]